MLISVIQVVVQMLKNHVVHKEGLGHARQPIGIHALSRAGDWQAEHSKRASKDAKGPKVCGEKWLLLTVILTCNSLGGCMITSLP